MNVSGQTSTVVTGVVEGRILNKVTGDYPLNAQVSVKGTEHVTLTGHASNYRLPGLTGGNVILRAGDIGLHQ